MSLNTDDPYSNDAVGWNSRSMIKYRMTVEHLENLEDRIVILETVNSELQEKYKELQEQVQELSEFKELFQEWYYVTKNLRSFEPKEN